MSYSLSATKPRRRLSSSPRLAVAGLGAAAACSLLLSGCGGGTQANAAAPAAAPASSSAATTVSGADLATKMTAAIKKAGSGKLVFESGNEKTEATFRYTATGIDQSIVRKDKGATTMELVGVDNVVYVKGVAPSTGAWVKLAATDKGPAAEKAGWLKSENSPLDFTMLAKFGKFTQVSANADGKSYEASVEACAMMGGCDGKNSGGAPIKVTATVDSQDRPLKFAIDQMASATYSDWGKTVTITAPKLEVPAAAAEEEETEE